jgi:hypothetical protein
MKAEAPTATETLLVKMSKRLKAGLVVDERVPPVFALWEIPEGSEPSTNEAPHWDSRTGLEAATEEGTSLAQILKDALLQSVQVILAGTELGGLSTTSTTFDRVSGPVTVSTLVRVSLTHRVLPCLRQNILRIVGYNCWTDGVREVASDVMFKSVEQPAVRFATTAARVALLQAGPLHMLTSQVLMGSTREVLGPAVATEMKEGMARHRAAS